MTSLDEVEHDDHPHPCVNCNEELFEANNTIQGRKKYLCTNEECDIAITICNGTLNATDTTVQDLIESARSVFSYLEESDGFTKDQLQSVSSAQKSLRKMIQGEKERLTSENLHEDIQTEFEEFTEIAKTLYQKENNDDVYQSPEGEQVVEMNSLYYNLSDVLLYTVLFYPEQEEGDIYQKPIGEDRYYEEYELEPYIVDLEHNFREADLILED